ncbi:alpha/beta fold hydrolase [Jatrophihabitans sp. YIM 134969]
MDQVHTTTLTVGDTTLDVEVFGPDDPAGPTVVAVHGALVDGTLWHPVARRLAAQGVRTVVPTLPLGSHRRPVAPGDELSPRGVARMVGAVVDAFGRGDVVLLGNDTGGAITQFLLDERPDVAAAVVLTNCDAFTSFPPAPFGFVFRLLRTRWLLPSLAVPLRLRTVRHSALGYGLLVTRPDPALTWGWAEAVATRRDIRRDLVRLLRAVDPTDLDVVTRRIGASAPPATLVWGQRDRAFSPALCRRLAAALPGSRVVEVEGSRTFVPLDAPDAVVDAVLAAVPVR